MHAGVSSLLSATIAEVLSVLTGFVGDHLDVVISIALTIGVIFLLYKLVGKY